MAKGTPKNFVIQQVYEILIQKPSDESIIGYLKHCKTSSIENTQEMVYPSGKFFAARIVRNDSK